ncbi:aliphatic sulfonate ABC transporter substrate-binding protein [Gulosibacter chungangensis]|uniref:Putative aliphatic sulfonates-binding protein n=1 Tax=Gulosibacter chungangensis TaxID=979746 RepID=A0A7J5BGF9_9MICO|nr:aliphatic sulfonate ABC transporter substrate-binding protein [Gulosibacter chungangensis]KAB1644720.1 aliphatic sulfonate ABC transporter substrate-binding protein [Gulosibacter chungangensis]
MNKTLKRVLAGIATATIGVSALAGCSSAQADGELTELNIDYATYSILSLVIKDQGWLEEELEGVDVNWIFSAGSNKANESLRAETADIATTGGGPAVQARANGTKIKTVYITHASEGFGFVVPEGSDLQSVEDLAGSTIAVTRGTDPYFFALQALEQHGLTADDVTLENLQHADGRTALENGTVDAWSGLDPIMASAELNGNEILYTDPSLISPIFLNANESFIEQHPETVQVVIDTYEKARQWVAENPEETLDIYMAEAGLEEDVAALALSRFNFENNPVPVQEELGPTLATIGGFMVESGDVTNQEAFDEALDTLFDPQFAETAVNGSTE